MKLYFKYLTSRMINLLYKKYSNQSVRMVKKEHSRICSNWSMLKLIKIVRFT